MNNIKTLCNRECSYLRRQVRRNMYLPCSSCPALDKDHLNGLYDELGSEALHVQRHYEKISQQEIRRLP
jgi:hypothetical protein